MGPLNKSNYHAEPSSSSAAEIYHFAHLHPLQLSYHHRQTTQCSACTCPISTQAYGCGHCNFYLHVSCSKLPQQLEHPFKSNKAHFLTLLPKSVYPGGGFNCDACGHHGSGFTYHCSVYRIDLHVLCATLPSVASVPSHKHQLTRVFSPPYPDKKFMCDVCKKPGSKTWLYHCRTCRFDAHLGCAARHGVNQTQQPVVVQNVPPVFVQMAEPMMYYQHVPMAEKPRPGLQIIKPIFDGGLNGLGEVVMQQAANVVMGAFMG